MSVVAYMLASDVHSWATVPNGKICNENHFTKKGPTTIELQCDTPRKRERSKIQPIWSVQSWSGQWPSTPTQAKVSNKIWTLQYTEFIQLTNWRQTEEVANEVIAWPVLRDLSTVTELLKEFPLVVESEGSSSSENPVSGASGQLIGSQFVSWYLVSLRYRIILSSQLHLIFSRDPF